MIFAAEVPVAPRPFIDRRHGETPVQPIGRERRQFANSHDDLSPDARELAAAVDQYKLLHRRRFITYEELLSVFRSLGYQR
ncbi:MAG: hypothetical protein KF708_08360 [Pirellulales bacterium]|nr:hypothetical protein [Pirellulales bacterium]